MTTQSAVQGERNGRCRLEQDDIPIIRALHADGMTQREIAEKFQVAKSTISAIITRRKWRHVEETPCTT
jgi:uncharacterized protein YjcR